MTYYLTYCSDIFHRWTMLNPSLSAGPESNVQLGKRRRVRSGLAWSRWASASDHIPITEARSTAFASLTGLSCSSRTFSNGFLSYFASGRRQTKRASGVKNRPFKNIRTLSLICIFSAFVPFLVWLRST